MEIRKAAAADIPGIAEIYERIHTEEENGRASIGWIRGVYPVRKTAEDACGRGDLFVLLDDGKIAAAAIINQIQVPEYRLARWKEDTPPDSVMVLHCLAVDPAKSGKGYGKRFVSFYESYARLHGCTALRMDTNARNTRARTLYRKLGYTEIGTVPCVFNGIPNVCLVCLEKYLKASDSPETEN